jgi:molybdopterin/thiamine biosynthesis adenylyltransferase
LNRVVIKIADDDFAHVESHLLREDLDEHAAIFLCGRVSTSRTEGLLVREVHLVDDSDFVPGEHGYRQIVPRLIAELSGRAADQKLSFVSVHSHPLARERNSLSSDDLASHKRLFPHLFDITHGRPVAGIALGSASAAGEVWFSRDGDDRRELDEIQVIGVNRLLLTSDTAGVGEKVAERFDRQARLFGVAGQRILGRFRVGVVGVGGGGSIIVEQLAHLGVGELILIDFDVVKQINLNRVVGARSTDAVSGVKKIEVARRLVRDVDPSISVAALDGDLADLAAAEALRDVDFIFLATDTITSRLVFNAVVHRYFVPGIQIGAKVELFSDSEPDVYAAVRPVFPSSGCLQCNGLIDPERLQEEERTEEERVAQNYLNVPEVVDPAVISLNGLAASWAVTTMLFYATGLAHSALRDQRLFFPRSGDVHTISDTRRADCLFCGRRGHYGLGDPLTELPVRQAPRRDPR